MCGSHVFAPYAFIFYSYQRRGDCCFLLLTPGPPLFAIFSMDSISMLYTSSPLPIVVAGLNSPANLCRQFSPKIFIKLLTLNSLLPGSERVPPRLLSRRS